MALDDRLEQQKKEHDALYAPLQETPIDLDQIFRIMIDSIRYNYVGFESRRRYFTPTEYRTYILSRHRYNTLRFQTLVRSLHQFTADMHDRHLVFHCDDWIDYKNSGMRFRVRAQRDCLWVTEAAPEAGLRPGDKILTVQHNTPEQIRRYMRYNSFYSREPERELWGGYLRMAGNVEVEHADGSRETVQLPQFPVEEVEYPITFQMLEGNTAYLKLERMDYAAMEALLSEHEAEIAGSDKLILDLRRCVGGDEDACWALFPYLVERSTSLNALLADEGSYVNCTKANCELRYRVLSEFQKTLTDSEQIALIEAECQFYLKNYGKGLVYKGRLPLDNVTYTPAAQAPAKVVVLTDTFCENEGEQFVSMCRRCGSKVTTLGRPTMGTLDTFDNITVALDEHMTLSYPIAMTKAAYEGRGIAEKGLPVDRYIPWTPAEIKEDILLRRALAV